MKINTNEIANVIYDVIIGKTKKLIRDARADVRLALSTYTHCCWQITVYTLIDAALMVALTCVTAFTILITLSRIFLGT